MRRVAQAASIALLLSLLLEALPASRADNIAQPLEFAQDWSGTALISTNNDWSGVPGITGFRGDGLASATAVDPQTILADGAGTPVNVLANEDNPGGLNTGGVAEFDRIPNPVVALQGSGTARAPHIVISLNTTGHTDITVSYNLRDIDGSADNSVQPVALQFRAAMTGSFTNIPAGFVADATTGPNQASFVTPVTAALPASANNQPHVEVRIITSDAAGSDEWVGIDDIEVKGTEAPTLARINSFNATARKGEVLIRWETGYEVNNLGFNIYREQGGERALINPDIIAGSAFLAPAGVALQSGLSYAWSDFTPERAVGVQYWLEDIDLNGQSTFHGPFAVDVFSEPPYSEKAGNSPLLRDVALSGPSTLTGSAPVEIAATFAYRQAQIMATLASPGSGPAIKLAVKQAGLYRVSQAQLIAAGLDVSADPRLLQLFVDGRQIPFIVHGQQDGRLDTADYIEFFGIGLRSPYSSNRIYWLVAGAQPGLRISTSGSEGGFAPGDSFPFTVERRDKTFFFSSLLNGEDENFFGPVLAGVPVSQSLALSNVASSTGSDALIEVSLQGITLSAHQVSVSLNDTEAGTIFFNDREKGSLSFIAPHSLLREGINTVKLARVAGNTGVSLVESVRISYQHTFRADSDSLLLPASSGEAVSIGGFTNPSVRLFDVTEPDSVQQVPASVSQDMTGEYRLTATAAGKGERKLFAVSDAQLRQADAITANAPSSLGSTSNGANLVIITRSDLLPSLALLKSYRQSRGLSVAVIDVEDIYDEFSFGHKSPFAIRDFLHFTQSWKKAPRFVLLAGDGTYDPKGYQGGASADLIPIKLVETATMETASDDWYVDFNNDVLADLAIGRLPARTAQEMSQMITKIITYEQKAKTRGALLVSDVSDESFDFEAATAEVSTLIPASEKVTQIYRSQLGDAAAKARLIEEISLGPKVVNYVGHGTLTNWKGNLLTAADAQSVGEVDRLSVFISMTCLNGLFHNTTGDSLAEALIKSSGGAVAVWASSGLTGPRSQAVMNQEVVRQLFAKGATTIGEATNRAKAAVLDGNVRRTWILFGDPATSIK